MSYINYQILIGSWPLILIAGFILLVQIWRQITHHVELNVFIRRVVWTIYSLFLLSTLFFPITISTHHLSLISAWENIVKIPLIPLIDELFLAIVAASEHDLSNLSKFIFNISYHFLILMPFAYLIRRESKTYSSFSLWLITILFSVGSQLIRLALNFFSGFFFFTVSVNSIILNIFGSAIVLIIMHIVRKNYLKNRGYNWKIRGPRNLAQTVSVKRFLNKKIKENSTNYRGEKITRKTKWN